MSNTLVHPPAPIPSLATALPAAAALLLFVIGITGTSAAPAPNPHWKPDACTTCHIASGDALSPIHAAEVNALCLSCHDGRRATAEAHPIARPVDKTFYPIPPNFPLTDARLACLTCHDAKKACTPAAKRPYSNSAFLRSPPPPPKPATPATQPRTPGQNFCNNCHVPERYAKFNPHIMLTPPPTPGAARGLQENACLFCHEKVNPRVGSDRTGSPNIRLDQLTLCRSCHPTHKEIYKNGHIGVAIPPDMLAYMKAREMIGLLGAPTPALLKELKDAGAEPTRLVPDRNGTITCTTCHNPHQYGLFPPDSPLAYQAIRVVNSPAGPRTVSPVHNENWCNNCHSF